MATRGHDTRRSEQRSSHEDMSHDRGEAKEHTRGDSKVHARGKMTERAHTRQTQARSTRTRGEGAGLEGMSRDDLYRKAAEAGIRGRSRMTKDQLIEALQKH